MHKTTKILIALTAILLVSLGAFIGLNKKDSARSKISIIATNFPAYDFARAVAGDKANVKMLIKPGAETHNFEPTPNDIIDLKNSRMFIYTGGESDEWVKKILNEIDPKTTKIIKMMDQVKTVKEELVEGMEDDEESHDHDHEHEDNHNHDHNHKHDHKHEHGHDHEHEAEDEHDHDHDHKYDHEHEHDHDHDHKHNTSAEHSEEGEDDEHVWTSPKNAIKIINAIKSELVNIAKDDAATFNQNTENYSKKLSDLDQSFRDIVASARRKTLVFGDRFPLRYFVDEYGLNYFAAFPGCSEQTEASSKTISFLIDKVKAEQIPVVLKIEQSNGKIAETISKATNAKVLTFQSAHNVSPEDFKKGVTYIDLMTGNLKVLKEALN